MTAPVRDAAPLLTVVLDLRHPFSYLALEPTAAMIRETGIGVDWLPIRGQTLRPPSQPSPGDDRSIRHRRARAQMVAREIAVYSAAEALELRSPYRDGSTGAVELAWLWVRDHQPASIEALLGEVFRRYWSEDLDPAVTGEVTPILQSIGCDVAAFEAWSGIAGQAAREAAATTLADTGVNQGPAYVLDGEVFYGRQHLPMLRWILNGRTGPDRSRLRPRRSNP